MSYLIQPMELDDIPEVSEIERACFSTSWSTQSYRREISENKLARYLVAKWNGTLPLIRDPSVADVAPSSDALLSARRSLFHAFSNRLISTVSHVLGLEASRGKTPVRRWLGGYAGIWLMFDEAHITTIGVRPSLRRGGLGTMLLIALADLSLAMGAERMTLEVRASNADAQQLYEKFGFSRQGLRPKYYSDNQEDAVVMTSEDLSTQTFMSRLEQLREALEQRIEDNPLSPPSEAWTAGRRPSGIPDHKTPD